MDADSIDTIITDPPYGLSFMGKDWDHGVPGVPFWESALRVAKPGATMLAFGGTRTHHRLMCAIEDAGWEIRDCMMWLYGSGFPKSFDISKGIDKAAGAEREVVGDNPNCRPNSAGKHSNAMAAEWTVTNITAPATDSAQEWQGWGTALKPSWEPIIVAMKPCDGTFVHNALTWGVAGLNIDGGRVATTDKLQALDGSFSFAGSGGANEVGKKIVMRDAGGGRWPANVVLSHTPECRQAGTKRIQPTDWYRDKPVGKQSDGNIVFNTKEVGYQKRGYTEPDGLETVEAWECAPDCPVRLLDEQSGNNTGAHGGHGLFRQHSWIDQEIEQCIEPSTGGASRFFYTAKASRSERNKGCDDFYWRLESAKPSGVERVDHETWLALGEEEERIFKATGKRVALRAQGNIHPTVKPVSLLRYLCKLTATPTGGIVYDPFMGCGSTGMAALQEGRMFVGAEIDKDYFDIACAHTKAMT